MNNEVRKPTNYQMKHFDSSKPVKAVSTQNLLVIDHNTFEEIEEKKQKIEANHKDLQDQIKNSTYSNNLNDYEVEDDLEDYFEERIASEMQMAAEIEESQCEDQYALALKKLEKLVVVKEEEEEPMVNEDGEEMINTKTYKDFDDEMRGDDEEFDHYEAQLMQDIRRGEEGIGNEYDIEFSSLLDIFSGFASSKAEPR